jgi:Spy/CpxP family protein refolding chaperone
MRAMLLFGATTALALGAAAVVHAPALSSKPPAPPDPE